MNQEITRRDLIAHLPAAGLAAGLLPLTNEAQADEPTTTSALWPGFPRQDLKLVREVVGVSHANLARVKELIKAQPALVNAWWDWGFGDWESPLGAASHVGQRAIAEFLLENGARIDIFAATMLGMTDTVKAFVIARPGVQRTLGPHGITLLSHAKAGGKQAEQTLAYLESLGDANIGPKVTPLADDRKSVYLGKYQAEEARMEFDVKLNKAGQLAIEITVPSEPPNLKIVHHLGNDEFFPSGVPTARIRFDVKENKALSLSIQETGFVLKANRVN